jgi:hypothetical protein
MLGDNRRRSIHCELSQSRPAVSDIAAPVTSPPTASFCALDRHNGLKETSTHLNALIQRIFSAIGAESDQWADGVVARVPWQLRQCLVTLGRAAVGGLCQRC